MSTGKTLILCFVGLFLCACLAPDMQDLIFDSLGETWGRVVLGCAFWGAVVITVIVDDE